MKTFYTQKSNPGVVRESYYILNNRKMKHNEGSFEQPSRTYSQEFGPSVSTMNSSRTSSDFSQFKPYVIDSSKIYTSYPMLGSCEAKKKDTPSVFFPERPPKTPESGSSLSHRKRTNSFIVLEINDPQQCSSTLLKNIKAIHEPLEFFEMNMLQQKIWQRLTQMTQAQINTAGKIEIIVNGPHEEYEMTVDLASIPYMWTVEHLAEIINQAFIQNKGKQVLQKAQLSMLKGKIKTERLNQNMRVFELINLMANGIKLLVLEECTA